MKLIQWLGSGRATLDLLRQRIWQQMVTPTTRAGRDRQVQPPGAASGSATAGSAWRPLAETDTQPTQDSSTGRMNPKKGALTMLEKSPPWVMTSVRGRAFSAARPSASPAADTIHP